MFPFGFGLSFSKFSLSALEVPQRVASGGNVTIRARLDNVAGPDGDEVVQLYMRPRVASAVTGKRLQAYRRVHLPAGQSQVVEFTLPARELATLDPQNRWTLTAGTYEVLLGTSSEQGLSGTLEVAN